MTRWHIQDGTEVKTLTEEKIRKKLRSGDISGLELARSDAESAWAPLHSLPLFREEVPMVGEDGAAVAARRALVGFGWHLVVFLAVIGGFTVTAGFPFWAAFWGIGLFFHGIKTLPALGVMLRGAAPAAAAPVAAPEAAAPAAALPDLAADPFIARLDGALQALADAAAAVAGPAPDIDGIRSAASALHQRRVALEAAASPEELAELDAERAEVQARLEAAPDERTALAYAAELAALDDRLAAGRDIAAAADRLAARERALLHNLAGMRASTLQAAAADTPAPDLAAQAAALRDEARATDEVDEALARARRATQRQRQ